MRCDARHPIEHRRQTEEALWKQPFFNPGVLVGRIL